MVCFAREQFGKPMATRNYSDKLIYINLYEGKRFERRYRGRRYVTESLGISDLRWAYL